MHFNKNKWKHLSFQREDCSFFPAFRKKRSLTLIKEDQTLTVGPLNLNDDVRLVDHVLSGTIEEEHFEEVDENNKIKYQGIYWSRNRL